MERSHGFLYQWYDTNNGAVLSNPGDADCTAHARAFLLDPRWGWNAARTLGVDTPPLPLPAARGTTILPFKPQPTLAQAAD